MIDIPDFLKRPAGTSPAAQQPIPSKGGRALRAPARIGEIMVAVVWCALFFTVHRAIGVEYLPALLILALAPVCGALAQRRRGGRGILGGVIGGIFSSIGLGVVMEISTFLYPVPGAVYFPGPVLSFMILSCYGAVVGLAAGILVWGASVISGISEKCRARRLGL